MLHIDTDYSRPRKAGHPAAAQGRRKVERDAPVGRNKLLMLRSQLAHRLDYCLRGGGSVNQLFDLGLRDIRSADGTVEACRAIVRFTTGEAPSFWLDTARRFGLLADLELRIVAAALRLLRETPEGRRIVLEVTPQTALEPQFAGLVYRHAFRLGLKLVPCGPLPPSDLLSDALQPLLDNGMQLCTPLEALFAADGAQVART